jgi:hypothetical protein
VYDSPPSPPSPSPRPSPRRTGEFGTAPSSPLDRVLARYRPRREVSSSPLCGINVGAVHLTGAHRDPPLPFPRAPIKGSPRAPPSPHRPQPPPSSPARAQFRGSAVIVFLSGKTPPFFSLPLWLCSKQLARPIRFATPPRVWNATPLPQSPPEGYRRRLPPRSSATSPRTAPFRPPLAKLSPPLGLPAPNRAKAPTRCPRNGSPVVNHRRAHRRPGPPPRTAGSSCRQPLTSFSPLPLSLACGPRGDVVALARPCRFLPWAATRPAHSRPRARCAWLG